MRFSRSIVANGTEAVKAYREMAGLANDNEVPEIFLSGWIARRLYGDFRLNTRVERYFTAMAKELGQTVDLDLVSIMGGWRADVAIYESGKPVGIVEVKIHDDHKQDGLVLNDLRKVRELSRLTGIETYLAVLITDTAKQDCHARAKELSQSLGKPFDVLGDPVRAGGGRADWSWLFACGEFA